MDRKMDRQTDERKDGQMKDRRADIWTSDRQTNRNMGIHSEMSDRHSLADRWADRKTDRQIDGQTDGQMTDQQRYGQTERLLEW